MDGVTTPYTANKWPGGTKHEHKHCFFLKQARGYIRFLLRTIYRLLDGSTNSVETLNNSHIIQASINHRGTTLLVPGNHYFHDLTLFLQTGSFSKTG